jgi:hypothetical protein
MHNAKQNTGGAVDETQALRTVKLTHFVLEACPRSQAATFVLDDLGALPLLIFEELTAYLKRRQSGIRSQTPLKKVRLERENYKITICVAVIILTLIHFAVLLNSRLP